MEGFGAVEHVAVRGGVKAASAAVGYAKVLLALVLWKAVLVLMATRASGLVEIVVLFSRLLVAMRVVTVDDVRRHELVDDPRDQLDANHASKEAGNQNPRGGLW